jgi:hypothetical protein
MPHPQRLCPELPFIESEDWFACGPPPVALQGWKLYVPLTLLNASKLLEGVAPFAQRAGLHFKYIKSIALLRKLNAGIFGYAQIGKNFVIYLPELDTSFVESLKEALAPYRDECPAVPCAIPFGEDLPLYYRYGSYRSSRLQLAGGEVDDNREDLDQAVPPEIEDVLRPYTSPVLEDPAVQSFLLRYPVYEAIQQQGKGGIFLAMNLASETFQEVVLKVGYHRGQVQPDGSDGCDLLRREQAFYRELSRRGISTETPRLIDELDTPRKVILVLEHVPGTSLLIRKLQNQLTVQHLDGCWRLIERLHDVGLYLGDAKLANFLASDNGDLHILDFETAGIIGEKPSPIRTFFLKPDLADPRALDRAHFLASVLHPYEEGNNAKDRNFDLEACLSKGSETEISAWAREKLRTVLVG